MNWQVRTNTPPRAHLKDIAVTALQAVHGRTCVSTYLQANAQDRSVRIAALGKAASAMSLGAMDALGDRVASGLVITKPGHLDPELDSTPNLTQLEAGHPLPDQRSLAAGRALLDYLRSPPGEELVLFLLSGGTSSLVEVPAPGVDLASLQRANTWLLASGLPIGAVNAVRKRLSRIKGGGLLGELGARPAEVLLISDVPGDRLADIGSGLLIRAPAPLPPMPGWLEELIEGIPQPSTPPFTARSVPHQIVASLHQAKAAAAARGRALGHRVHLNEQPLEGDAVRAGAVLARMLLEGAPGLYVWGGETTVQLPARPGRGGRNQSLALAAARLLDGHSGIAVLALGTDGTDGPGADAGALVDGETVARGCRQGLDPTCCLIGADAGTFLEASGDLIHTGPTGTNVMDLVVGLKAS